MKMHPLLVGSSPTDPVKQAAAKAFGNPPAAIVQTAEQAARDWRFYENAIIHHHTCEADLYAEYKGGGAWREHYKTWRDACEPLGLSRRRIDKLIQDEVEIRPKRPTEDKADTLAKVNDLTNPLAELEAQLAKAVVRAGAPEPEPVSAPKPKASDPMENGETVSDYKTTHRPPTDNGKPVYALSVWKDLYNDYGHALNKIHDAHRALPNLKRRERMVKSTKDLMDEAESWKNEAKSL